MTVRTIQDLGFDSVDAYQRFHGLVPDGLVGPITQRSLDAPRFCAYPDRMDLGNSICRWGKRSLVYGFRGDLPGISRDDMRRAFQIAFDRWSAVCDIRASHIGDSSQAADIVIDTGRIDGPSGTLAYSELPCGSQDRQLKQKYDTSEPWVIADNVPSYRIDLGRVATHEVGHVIGVPHIGSGNLMAPTYSTRIHSPQAGDIQEAQARYGPPRVQPPPVDPGDGDPDAEFIWVKIPKSFVVRGL